MKATIRRFWLFSALVALLFTFLPFGASYSLLRKHWAFGQPFITCEITVGYAQPGDTLNTVRVTFLSWKAMVWNALIWVGVAWVTQSLLKRATKGKVDEKSFWEIAFYSMAALMICVIVVNDLSCWGTWASTPYFLWGASEKSQQLGQIIGVYVVVPVLGAIIAIRLLRVTYGPLRRTGLTIVITLVFVIVSGLVMNYLGGRLEAYYAFR